MNRLMPFFTFYGGKQRAARYYPAPAHDRIVEPFAGSAGYSLNHHDRQVILIDIDPVIVETWRYLIDASPAEIDALPDLEAGQTTADLVDLPPGARHLIGWWLNKGTSHPRRSPSTFMLEYPQGGPYWGERVRQRVVDQLPAIRHWQVEQGDYRDSPDVAATWFIDPPYQKNGGHRYRFGNARIDYSDLASWCHRQRGQVIVCEADDADWLPFSPLIEIDGTEGRQKQSRARMELIYLNGSSP